MLVGPGESLGLRLGNSLRSRGCGGRGCVHIFGGEKLTF